VDQSVILAEFPLFQPTGNRPIFEVERGEPENEGPINPTMRCLVGVRLYSATSTTVYFLYPGDGAQEGSRVVRRELGLMSWQQYQPMRPVFWRLTKTQSGMAILGGTRSNGRASVAT